MHYTTCCGAGKHFYFTESNYNVVLGDGDLAVKPPEGNNRSLPNASNCDTVKSLWVLDDHKSATKPGCFSY